MFLLCLIWVTIHSAQPGYAEDLCTAPSERSISCWGAKADGRTDNSNAFKAAADWANSGSQAAPKSLYFPSGVYLYSGGLVFTQPVTLLGTVNAVLSYTGNAEAIKFGPDGLTVKNYHYTPYVLDGLSFTGGASMTTGIYFNTFVTQTKVLGTRFINFGNPSAYNVSYQSQNWYNLIDGVSMWSQSGPYMNGIRAEGNDAGGTSDKGQSRTIVVNSLLQFNGGTGIYLNGFHSQLDHVTVSGNIKNPIQVGSWGTFTVIDHVYEEAGATTTGCIVFGDSEGKRTSTAVGNLTIRNSYCNLHNTDFSTKARYLVPANGVTVLKLATLENNIVSSVSAIDPLIVQNDRPGQTGNRVDGLFVLNKLGDQAHVPPNLVHTMGSAISPWEGTDSDASISKPDAYRR